METLCVADYWERSTGTDKTRTDQEGVSDTAPTALNVNNLWAQLDAIHLYLESLFDLS